MDVGRPRLLHASLLLGIKKTVTSKKINNIINMHALQIKS